MDQQSYKTSFTEGDVLLSQKEVLQLIKYTKQGLYKLMRQGHFPRPIQIGARRVAWVQSEVLTYIAARLEERNNKMEL